MFLKYNITSNYTSSDTYKGKSDVTKGAKLESIVTSILNEHGHNVLHHEVWESGIDIYAVDSQRNIIVIECLNWEAFSYCNYERFQSLINNFSKYPTARKILLTPFPTMYNSYSKKLQAIGVEFMYIGKQVTTINAYYKSLVERVLYNKLDKNSVSIGNNLFSDSQEVESGENYSFLAEFSPEERRQLSRNMQKWANERRQYRCQKIYCF